MLERQLVTKAKTVQRRLATNADSININKIENVMFFRRRTDTKLTHRCGRYYRELVNRILDK